MCVEFWKALLGGLGGFDNRCVLFGVSHLVSVPGVGWTPESVGSVKWGYKTAVTWCGGASNGGSTDCPRVTPQAAFSAWYFGRHKSGSSVMIVDDEAFNANPTCVFTDSPVA